MPYHYSKLRLILGNNVDRDEVALMMKSEFGIDTGSIYYPPCHLHPWYKTNFGSREGDLPVSEIVLKQVLCLPMHLGVTANIVQYVVDSLNKCLSKFQR
jgi:dTDP-4-amino-4,6-dideoxygalactose transaminase